MNRLRARLLHRERGRIKLWGIGASLALTGATVAAWSVLGGIGAGATSFSAHTSTVGACTTPTPTPTGGQAAVANNVAPASSCDPESTPSPTPKDGKGNDEGPADDCDKLADRSKPYEDDDDCKSDTTSTTTASTPVRTTTTTTTAVVHQTTTSTAVVSAATTSAPAPQAPSAGVQAAAVSAPNTGADIPFGLGLLAVGSGMGLIFAARRRNDSAA